MFIKFCKCQIQSHAFNCGEDPKEALDHRKRTRVELGSSIYELLEKWDSKGEPNPDETDDDHEIKADDFDSKINIFSQRSHSTWDFWVNENAWIKQLSCTFSGKWVEGGYVFDLTGNEDEGLWEYLTTEVVWASIPLFAAPNKEDSDRVPSTNRPKNSGKGKSKKDINNKRWSLAWSIV